MRMVFSILLLFSLTSKAQSFFYQQPAPVDSFKQVLATTTNDTLRMVSLNRVQNYYFTSNTNLDSALYYSRQLVQLTEKLHYKIDEAYALDAVGLYMNFLIHPQTLETLFKGIRIAEDPSSENNILPQKYLEMMIYWQLEFTILLTKKHWQPQFFRTQILASLYNDLGAAYARTISNQQKAFIFLHKAIQIYESHKDSVDLGIAYKDIAEYFASINQYDSSIHYAQQAYNFLFESRNPLFIAQMGLIGTMLYRKGDVQKALSILRQAILFNARFGYTYGPNAFWLPYHTLGEYHLEKGERDSSLYFSKKALDGAHVYNMPLDVQKASALMAKVYKALGNSDSAAKYYELTMSYNDSVNNIERKRALQSQDFDEQMRQQVIVESNNKIKTYWLLTGLGMLAIISGILLRNNRRRKKINALLEQKNLQIEKAYADLKATQAQLIQSEKMASLGELTAGIAHEIQNPLNFVNNFSETNKELIAELKEEATAGNIEYVLAIAADIENNEEKIAHHGRRADNIVKGMLEHSRTSSGKKELTDLNKLADEYFRLAYHGFRAKDKSFNATMQTHFADSIEKINIVPQDIGRVLLNLFNNAFFAVAEKKKHLPEGYEPIVTVSTKKLNDKIEISVKDNGSGIPNHAVHKIFQPFFTTKPTGQGTGLGLSLSYDIIKAHGGEIRVNTKEGQGSEFIVELPSK